MRMCVESDDLEKDGMKTDRYYIYNKEIAQSRTVLCHGCVGTTLLALELKAQDERDNKHLNC